jgi:hypothetical protein
MNDYASVSGNTATDGGGGGVYAHGGATSFIMNDSASISGNTATGSNGGGGVASSSGASFTMNDDASISGNNAGYYGGGVYISSSTFLKNGGTIAGNPTVNHNGSHTAGSADRDGCNVASNGQGHAVYSTSNITIGGITAQSFNDDLDENANTP